MSYNYHLLKEDVTIESYTTDSVDDYGLYNTSWSTATTTKGRLVARGSQEEDTRTEILRDDFDLYIPASVTINGENRVNISSTYYEIVGIETKKNRQGRSVMKVVSLRKSR